MRSVLTLGLVSAFAALAAVAVVTPACTVGSDCDFGLCALPTTGTPGGTGDGGTPVDPCIATPTSSACLDESGALFVSPNGAATNEGSRAKPVGSLATALARIDGKRRRIYVCEGTYLEDLAFTAVHAGVSVIGGLDCQWAPKASAKPIFGASATPGRAFGASGLALVDVAIEAKDATDGGSSVALFVSGGDVTLQRVRLVAGKGATGAAGKLEPVQFPLPDVLRGQNGDATNGGKEVSFACPGGVAGTSFVTKGGAGGSPGNAGASGEPLVKAANGGVAGPCNGPGTGGDGNPATEVAARGASAKTHGTLGPGGWTPADGEQGATGKPGQGGGGGFGLGGGGGGGGGAGGCGGAGGGGGKGGGASIALAILGAKVTVGGSTVRADTGGPGGPGVGGQPGMPQGGARGGSGVACSGGSGAPGNPGGAGGGGAGGISVGILSSGATVVQPDAQNAITAGAGGAGGLDGTAESRAVDGLSEAIRSL